LGALRICLGMEEKMSKQPSIEVKKRDSGYYFPAVDIHVVAKSEKAALKLIKETHGLDVAEVTAQQAKAAAELAKSEENHSKKTADDGV